MSKKPTIKPKMPVLQVSVTEAEKIQHDQHAKDLGFNSLSAYCRTILNKYGESYYRSQKATLKK